MSEGRPPCQHERFKNVVNVHRGSAQAGGPAQYFRAEVTCKCAFCGEQFRFIGIPIGKETWMSPVVSKDGLTLSVPLRPASEPAEQGIAGGIVMTPGSRGEPH